MVQIIEENRRLGGKERFAQALGNIGAAGGQALAAHYMGGKQREMQSKEDKKLSEILGQDVSGLSPEMKKVAFQQIMTVQQQGLKQDRKENYLNQLFGQGGNQPTQGMNRGQGFQGSQGMPQNPQEMGQQGAGGFDVTQLTDEDLARAASVDPNMGRALSHAKDVALREKREERNFATKQVSSSYKENEPYITKTYDQYEDSLRKDAILERMDQLEESGELSDSGVMNLLQGLGLKQEWLKNPANEEYTKLGLDLLGGGTLQADYGSRVLASEFKVSQQRIPTLMQTPEGRKQIKENLRTMLLPAKLKQERLQFYLDQAERTGKPLPHNLRGKILSDIKPQLEEAYDKFKERNGRYQVKQGTYPDDNAIEKYYYLSEGNEEKAKKMMKEDGYNVGDANDRGLSGGSARIRSTPKPKAGIY